MQIIYSRR